METVDEKLRHTVAVYRFFADFLYESVFVFDDGFFVPDSVIFGDTENKRNRSRGNGYAAAARSRFCNGNGGNVKDGEYK